VCVSIPFTAYTFKIPPLAFIAMRQFPQELIDNTIHHLVEDSETSDVNMRTCSLVAKSWTPQAQKEQFQSVYSLTLDTSKKLLALIVGSPHIGAYIKFLTLRVDSLDVGTETRDLAVLPEITKSLSCLEGLDLSVVPYNGRLRNDVELLRAYISPSHRVSGPHSYLCPPALILCLQNANREHPISVCTYRSHILGPNRITNLVLLNWKFTDISSLISIFTMTHLKVLTLHSCYLEASGSAPLPITQPVLISIDLLELRHCRLMLDILRWAAAVPMALKTVEIESDDQQYLTYILDNKLRLSVENICLVINSESCESQFFPRNFLVLKMLPRRGNWVISKITGTLSISVRSPGN
jgi:hypothetical protein